MDKIANNISPEAYDSPSFWYDIRGFFILKLAYRSSLFMQVKFFSNNISKNHLEAAIGTGSLSLLNIILKKFIRGEKIDQYIGIDYSSTMLNGCRKLKFLDRNIKLAIGDLTKLSYKDNCFDSINLANSYHTIKDIDLAMDEIHRVLVPGGTFRFNVLLNPSTNSFLDRISNKINRWGQIKGILNRPYSEQEVINALLKFDYKICDKFSHYNCLYIEAVKAKSI